MERTISVSGPSISVSWPPARPERDWEGERVARANRPHLSEAEVIKMFSGWTRDDFINAAEHKSFPRARRTHTPGSIVTVFSYPKEEVETWKRDTYPALRGAGVLP